MECLANSVLLSISQSKAIWTIILHIILLHLEVRKLVTQIKLRKTRIQTILYIRLSSYKQQKVLSGFPNNFLNVWIYQIWPIKTLLRGQGLEVCLYEQKRHCNNRYDWLNWIKECRNHFHLFILAIEDLWCKDESWLWKASSKKCNLTLKWAHLPLIGHSLRWSPLAVYDLESQGRPWGHPCPCSDQISWP